MQEAFIKLRILRSICLDAIYEALKLPGVIFDEAIFAHKVVCVLK